MASAFKLEDEFSTPTSEPVALLQLPISTGPAGANRRFLPRVNAKFQTHDLVNGGVYEGIDISFGGMLCIAEDPLWPGHSMQAEIILPHADKPIPVLAKVVELVTYRGHLAMRMRFEEILDKDRRRIAQWMARSV